MKEQSRETTAKARASIKEVPRLCIVERESSDFVGICFVKFERLNTFPISFLTMLREITRLNRIEMNWGLSV